MRQKRFRIQKSLTGRSCRVSSWGALFCWLPRTALFCLLPRTALSCWLPRTAVLDRLLLDRSRKGAAAVEFALVLPLLLTMVLGAVDFGRFAHSLIAVTNAARAGAGFACMHPTTTNRLAVWQGLVRAAVLTELNQTLGQTGVAENEVVTTIPAPVTESGSGSGTRWSASVTVSMPFRTLVQWPTLPQNITLTRTTTVRGIR